MARRPAIGDDPKQPQHNETMDKAGRLGRVALRVSTRMAACAVRRATFFVIVNKLCVFVVVNELWFQGSPQSPMITHVHAHVPLHTGVQKTGLVPALTGTTAISKPVQLKTDVRYFCSSAKYGPKWAFILAGRWPVAGRSSQGRRRRRRNTPASRPLLSP